jgi:hypothetical protein
MADFKAKRRTPEQIKQAWRDDLPVCAAEAAAALEVNRSTIHDWFNMTPALPRVGRYIRRTDFEAWWKRASRARARRKAGKAEAVPSPKVIEFPSPQKPIPTQARALSTRADFPHLPPRATELLRRASAL